jgi:beta-galactosidase/beta-glucuronidase
MKSVIKLFFILLPLFSMSQKWEMKKAPLMTSFANDLNPDKVLPEYPRPQLVREQWMNLNGLWQFQPGIVAGDVLPTGKLSRSILVPFPVESALSGVMEHYERLWYRRTFVVPSDWQEKKILLHFGAVDYESEVYVNGKSLGIHEGGYDPFSLDITPFLKKGEQELTVRVFDPTDNGGYPRGKQTLNPQGIMYTSVTGIWQTVWLEPVPETHITNVKLVPDIDQSVLKLTISTDGNSKKLKVAVVIKDGEKTVQQFTGLSGTELSVPLPNAKLWSPNDPFLYNLEIKLESDGKLADQVGSYFGMRKISIHDENGFKKLYLNNKLSQGKSRADIFIFNV